MPQLISVFLSVVKCGVDFLAAFADLASGTALRPVSSFFIGSPSDGSAHAAVCGFRHNRRKTNGVGRIAARVIEKLVAHPPRTMRQIIDESRRCPRFASNQTAAA